MNSPFRQLALQAAAALLVLSLAWPYFGMRAEAMPWLETSLVIGAVALAAAWLTRQPVWWRVMHGLFMPLAWAVTQLAIDPGWFLLAFIVLLLIYRGALTGQVPLYLSSAETVEALAGMLTERPPGRFADIGAGIGSTLLPLARRFPETHFTGIENAPLPWLIGWLRTRGHANIDWRWGDFWKLDLAGFDFVYAFLSPAPMPALWQKVGAEMRSGSVFISNSFAVPEVVESAVMTVPGSIPRLLYRYQR